MYHEFMDEYLSLCYMTLVNPVDETKVQFAMSTTTKFRTVFNASTLLGNALSFNDLQEKGPTLQQDLFGILVRFRTHEIALDADIEKLYHQVRVAEAGTWYQCIRWRKEIYRICLLDLSNKQIMIKKVLKERNRKKRNEENKP